MKKLLPLVLVAATASAYNLNNLKFWAKKDSLNLKAKNEVKFSNDGKNIVKKFWKEVEVEKNEKNSRKNHLGLAFPCIDEEGVISINTAVIEKITDAANGQEVITALAEKAAKKIAKAIRANCTTWSTKEDILAVIAAIDLSSILEVNQSELDKLIKE